MASPASPLSLLHDAPLFAGVDAGHLATLAQAARSRDARAGQLLFAEGDEARAFYLVAQGEVHLYRFSPQGEEKVFQMLGDGDLLAEAAMFLSPAVYPMTARAVRDSTLFAVPRQALLSLCAASPPLMLTLLSALARRLYQAMNRIDHLTLNNAGQRLVAYLLDLRRQQHGNWISIPVNFAVLAAQLGMTPETLSRLLQKFRQDGLLSGKGRTLVLLDADMLCEKVALPRQAMRPPSHIGGNPSMTGCCNLAGKR
ncbi:Transcriptional Regulator, Crp/Fnr family [Thiobacillus denitrificans ATCC 25259]|uniref:Transcriptional Regulator, Crp/Fnr family n=1 Tax=Thiobacillus denitrificans (strain ATCC 25259 / T1) TaxID=292415 RepID=Q3SFR0_THIDA|nr:Crp/Fnr family transcriptional regulator [Thiobacillus denitrificans]AAZ98546.1 Transcriptional Regulator, Crp/Fnr family [Thiobacillus denitrificans ATCC 25259]